MVTTPMKCKICGKIISPPDEALIIGESPQVRNQKILGKLYSHVQGKMQEEQKQPIQPHTQILIQATVVGENLKGALLIGNFEISPDMEAERRGVLARVHEITRTVRITDQEILQTIHKLDEEWSDGRSITAPNQILVDLLRDLRDRYEGLGKYAKVSDAGMMGAHPIDEVKK